MLIILFSSMVICVFILMFFRYCAGLLVCLIILTILALLFGAGVLIYFEAQSREEIEQSIGTTSGTFYEKSSNLFIYSYIIFGIAGLVTLIILCFASDIAVAVSVIKTASLYVAQHPLVILIPILTLLAVFAFIIFWIITSLYLYTIGTQTKHASYPFAV